MSDSNQTIKINIDAKAATASLKGLTTQANAASAAIAGIGENAAAGVAQAANEVAIQAQSWAARQAIIVESLAAEMEARLAHYETLDALQEERDAMAAERGALQMETEAAQREEALATLTGFLAQQEALQLQSQMRVFATYAQVTELLRQQEAIRNQIKTDGVNIAIAEQTRLNAELTRLEEEKNTALLTLKTNFLNQDKNLQTTFQTAATVAKQMDLDFTKKVEEAKALTTQESLKKAASAQFSNFKQMGEVNRAFAMADALTSTYRAANAAYAALAPTPFVGPALGAAAAAAAIAAGMNNVRQIQQQKFARGGIVSGYSLAGDTRQVLVNSGELILNKAQQDSIAGQLNSSSNSDVVEAIRENTAAIRDLKLYITDEQIFNATNRVVVGGRRLGV